MRLIKRVLISIVLSTVVLGTGLLVASYVFEDEIVLKAKESINELVDTEIDVKSLEFSLLRGFPKASLRFSEIKIQDRLSPDKSLLVAEEISLQFDSWALLKGQYSIQKAIIKNGSLSMNTDASGQVNYIFWKVNEGDTEVEFDIEDLELQNVNFTLSDVQADMNIRSQVKRASLSMQIQEGIYQIEGELEGNGTALIVDKQTYLAHNDLDLDVALTVSEEGRNIKIHEGDVYVGQNYIPVTGTFIKEDYWYVDLQSKSRIEVDRLLAELSEELVNSTRPLALKGNVNYELVLRGESSSIKTPELVIQFDWNKGSFKLKDEGAELQNVRAQGKYTRDGIGNEKVELEKFLAAVPQGDLSFSGSISNLQRPFIVGIFSCDAALHDLIALSDQDIINNIEGEIKVQMAMDGRFPSDSWTEAEVKAMNLFGSADLSDVSFDLSGNGYHCQGLSTRIVLKDDAVILDKSSILINNDLLELSGTLDGLWAYFFNDAGRLRINATAKGESIHWDRWASAAEPHSGGVTSLPDNLDIDLHFDMDEFSFKDFAASGIKGTLNLSENSVRLRPLAFNSCQGAVTAELSLGQLPDSTWTLRSSCSLDKVDVPIMFREFGQFGQDFLIDQQIKGEGDAQIDFFADLDEHMTMISSSIVADATVTIRNGELIEHPAMIDIVDQLRDRHLLKPFVRADELEKEMHHLRFERLQNTVEINNGVISIPEMLIANNAMDVGVSGTHSFDNVIDYSIDFTLRDILVNKSNPEFIVQDDGLGHRIHLSMTGTTDDPIVALDKQAVKENRKEAIAEAKEDIKEFFSNPFKKKDAKKDNRSAVMVELEGAENPAETSPKEDNQKKKQWWKMEKEDELEEIIIEEEQDDF